MMNLSDELSELLQKSIDENPEASLGMLIDCLEGLDSADVNVSWEDEGKYSYGEITAVVGYKGSLYHIEGSQTRTGSYHSDYYYQDATIHDVLTDEEANRPTVVASFVFRGKTVTMMSNGTVEVEQTSFKSVEEAIESIL